MTQSKNPPAAEAADEREVAPVAADTTPKGDTSRRTADELAEIVFPPSGTGRLHDDAWKHAAAEQLHGWKAYEARSGKKPVMDRKTYEAAIAATISKDLVPYAAADFSKKG